MGYNDTFSAAGIQGQPTFCRLVACFDRFVFEAYPLMSSLIVVANLRHRTVSYWRLFDQYAAISIPAILAVADVVPNAR